tara:strand:- start:116 stop:496 length:381 start_codon:yes stop_codon:yes gene_type:complete
MKQIYSKSPTATVYQCEDNGIHLVIRAANIVLNESEFHCINEQIQRVSVMIDNGTWPCEYVHLTFCKVTLVVHANELLIVANVMDRATVIMQNRRNEQKIIDIKKGREKNTLSIINNKKLRPFLKN